MRKKTQIRRNRKFNKKSRVLRGGSWFKKKNQFNFNISTSTSPKPKSKLKRQRKVTKRPMNLRKAQRNLTYIKVNRTPSPSSSPTNPPSSEWWVGGPSMSPSSSRSRLSSTKAKQAMADLWQF